MIILPSKQKGIIILRLWVNDKEADSSIDDYVQWWLEDSYDETIAGSTPEVVRDPTNVDFFWSLSGAKRALTHWTVHLSHPSHWSNKEFNGFSVWCYDSSILRDYESMRYLVVSGNKGNRFNVGQLLPDRLEACQAIFEC